MTGEPPGREGGEEAGVVPEAPRDSAIFSVRTMEGVNRESCPRCRLPAADEPVEDDDDPGEAAGPPRGIVKESLPLRSLPGPLGTAPRSLVEPLEVLLPPTPAPAWRREEDEDVDVPGAAAAAAAARSASWRRAASGFSTTKADSRSARSSKDCEEAAAAAAADRRGVAVTTLPSPTSLNRGCSLNPTAARRASRACFDLRELVRRANTATPRQHTSSSPSATPLDAAATTAWVEISADTAAWPDAGAPLSGAGGADAEGNSRMGTDMRTSVVRGESIPLPTSTRLRRGSASRSNTAAPIRKECRLPCGGSNDVALPGKEKGGGPSLFRDRTRYMTALFTRETRAACCACCAPSTSACEKAPGTPEAGAAG